MMIAIALLMGTCVFDDVVGIYMKEPFLAKVMKAAAAADVATIFRQ